MDLEEFERIANENGERTKELLQEELCRSNLPATSAQTLYHEYCQRIDEQVAAVIQAARAFTTMHDEFRRAIAEAATGAQKRDNEQAKRRLGAFALNHFLNEE